MSHCFTNGCCQTLTLNMAPAVRALGPAPHSWSPDWNTEIPIETCGNSAWPKPSYLYGWLRQLEESCSSMHVAAWGLNMNFMHLFTSSLETQDGIEDSTFHLGFVCLRSAECPLLPLDVTPSTPLADLQLWFRCSLGTRSIFTEQTPVCQSAGLPCLLQWSWLATSTIEYASAFSQTQSCLHVPKGNRFQRSYGVAHSNLCLLGKVDPIVNFACLPHI